MKKNPALVTSIAMATGLLGLSHNAIAGGGTADLSIMIQAPATTTPLEQVQYYITIHNNGPKSAGRVKAKLELPANTTFIQASSECSLNGSKLTCNLGKIRKNRSHTLSVLLEAPTADGTISLSGEVNSRRADPNYLNNFATYDTLVESPQVVAPEFPITSTVTINAQSCYGSGISQFSDCPAYAIMYGTMTLNTDQSISTGNPGVLGNWSQTDNSSIQMNFTDLSNNPISTFNGTAVSETCFEGTVTPNLATTDGAWRGCAQ